MARATASRAIDRARALTKPLHALRSFYLALGAFAAAGLVSLIGATVASSTHHIIFRIALGLALITGVIGVGGLVFGCTLLVAETQIAVQNLSEEAALIRERYKDYLTASEKFGEPG